MTSRDFKYKGYNVSVVLLEKGYDGAYKFEVTLVKGSRVKSYFTQAYKISTVVESVKESIRTKKVNKVVEAKKRQSYW